MRKLLLGVVALLTLAGPVAAQVAVRGYVKKDGTYVAPHYRSSPNSTTYDNYSTRGNVNPYTGQSGTRTPSYGSSYGSSNTNSYGSSYSQPKCYPSLYNPC